ncbi:unnamed protein product [Mortierella alpina]
MTVYANAAQRQSAKHPNCIPWHLSPFSPRTKSVLDAWFPENDSNLPAELTAEPTQSASPQQDSMISGHEVSTLGFDPQVERPQQAQLQAFVNLFWNDRRSISDHIKHLSKLDAYLNSTPISAPGLVNLGGRTPPKTARRNHLLRKLPSIPVSESKGSSISDKNTSAKSSASKRSGSASSSPASSSTDLASNSCASRSRRRLKIEETEYLLEQFERSEKPTGKERAAIAARLNLDPRTVQVWFQNRRAKLKRDDCLANHLMAEGQEILSKSEKGDCVGQYAEGDSAVDRAGTVVATMDRSGLTTPACSLVQTRNSAHLGSGPGTFLGYERSYGDAGWNRLFESELAQLPNLDDLQLSTSMVGSEAFPDMHAPLDQFDMSTIDLVFGLDHENDLSVQNFGTLGQRLEARRPLEEEASPAPLVGRTEPVHRHSHPRLTLAGSNQDPAVGSMRSPPMRKASVMARLHSQIPVQQMAFTLVAEPSLQPDTT